MRTCQKPIIPALLQLALENFINGLILHRHKVAGSWISSTTTKVSACKVMKTRGVMSLNFPSCVLIY